MIHRIAGAAVALGLGVMAAAPGAAQQIDDVECIAPAGPGGGWDFTCRAIGRLLEEEGLISGSATTTNMPGAVGAMAWSMVMNDRAEDASTIVATSTVGITQIAQGKYPSGADAMRFIAMLGADVGVVMVAEDSAHDDLGSLMEMYAAEPGGMVAGGSSSVGGWDHLRLLLAAQEGGVAEADLPSLRWVQYDSGSDAVVQLMGGFVDVVVTDIGEIAGFVEAGDVKVLAVMADERLEAFPDIPTAMEQGVEMTGYNWRGLYTGGEVSDADYQAWVETLRALYETEAWKTTAVESGLTPIWRGGDEFARFVEQSEADMEAVSRAIGVIQ
jgi:putative tricarboxylic transport membrane protein